MNYAEIVGKADNISFCACDLFPSNPERINQYYPDKAFTMYSFDRIAKNVIRGIAQQLLGEGCSEKQIVEILQSKLIRWKLDANEDDLIKLGAKWAQEENWKNEFKEN